MLTRCYAPGMARFDSQSSDGTPFIRIFWAVFLALTAYGLLEATVKIWIARAAMQEFVNAMPPVTEPAREVAPQRIYPTRSQLPLYLGPIAARREGAQRSCINGLVALRVEGGWNQTNDACRASQE